MIGFAILLGFHLLGFVIQKATSLPLPANVIGLILFTASLFLKIVKIEWVEESARFLLKHMLLFFLPFVVGAMVYFAEIRESALSVVGGLLLSTLLSLLVTGRLTQWLERRTIRHE